MTLSSKDIEEINSKPFKPPKYANFVIIILNFFMKIPAIEHAVSESVGGIHGRIFRCWDRNEYEKAANIALHALEKYRNSNSFMNHHNWWSFMKHAVDSTKKYDNDEVKESLIEFANSGIEPFEGYDVAYCFLEFSRWKYYDKNQVEAINFANIALNAFKLWVA